MSPLRARAADDGLARASVSQLIGRMLLAVSKWREHADRVPWWRESLAGPGGDFLFLCEQDDLAAGGDLQQQFEDVAGACLVGVDGRVVEDERACLVALR